MHFEGVVMIQAPRQTVWHFLTDPQAVAWCVPGVTIIEMAPSNRQFKASVAAGFGNIHATFLTNVDFMELTSPEHAKFRAHGVASNAAVDATSQMNLKELPGGATEMKWDADVMVVGQLVVLASGRIEMVMRQQIEVFFERMQTRIETLTFRVL